MSQVPAFQRLFYYVDTKSFVSVPLKGPKREIFDFGVFAQVRPTWIGDLGTRSKNYKFLMV